MDFDFPALYENYSNIELLRILLHPDQYQQEAVQAAGHILTSRDVTDDERRAAGYVIPDPVSEEKYPMTNAYHQDITTDILEAFNPEGQKTVTIFKTVFVLLCLYYLYVCYSRGSFVILSLKYGDFSGIDILYGFIYLFLIPFAMIKLYKRKKAGWFIIIGENLLSFLPGVYYVIINRHLYFARSVIFMIAFLAGFLIKPAIIAFLWQKKNTEYLAVSKQDQRNAVLVYAGLLVAGIWMTYVVTRGISI